MTRKPKRARSLAEEQLDSAWDAFEEGDYERALELARGVDPEDPERCVLEANVLLECDDLAGARAALEGAGDPDDEDADPQLCWTAAEIELRHWDIPRARALFERAGARERPAPLLARLALCAELAGDLRGADRLLGEAAQLDPESYPPPPRLTEEQFEAVLDEAVERLPTPFREALEETQVLVDAVPTRAVIDPSDPAPTRPTCSGSSSAPRASSARSRTRSRCPRRSTCSSATSSARRATARSWSRRSGSRCTTS